MNERPLSASGHSFVNVCDWAQAERPLPGELVDCLPSLGGYAIRTSLNADLIVARADSSEVSISKKLLSTARMINHG